VGRIPAVIQYVFSAGRFKTLLPTQGVEIIFSLQGVYSDKPVKSEKEEDTTPPINFHKLYPVKDSKGEIIASNVALHYSRDCLYQHDVEVQIEDMDKYGVFFGMLYVNKTDYLPQLIETGNAKVQHRSAEKLPSYKRYEELETKAKNAKKGLWWNYDPTAKKAEEPQNVPFEEQPNKPVVLPTSVVTVTDIMTGSTFYFQEASPEKQAYITDMMSDFQAVQWQAKQPFSPDKKRTWVAAKFSVDGNWYRAEVIRIISPANEKEEKKFEIRYVDYGNTEITTSKNLRALEKQFFSSACPAQAKRGKLAYIRAPSLDQEYGEDAAVLFKELVWGKNLKAIIQFEDVQEGSACYHLQLGEAEKKTNFNALLVIQGLARVDRVDSKQEFYKRLQEEEDKAKKARLGIWQYGAVPDSDEERVWATMLK